MDAVAQNHLPPGLQAGLAAVAARLQADPLRTARTVVLLPYAQLMPVARELWVALAGGSSPGFVPRFETTMNWARSLAGFAPDEHDLSFDMARDPLTAQALLARGGFATQANPSELASRLVEAAWQLGGVASAVPPALRSAWAADLQAAVGQAHDAALLAQEVAVARLALLWAGHSAYATDVLFSAAVNKALDCLVVFDGFQTDPLTHVLKTRFSDRLLVCALFQPADNRAVPHVNLHEATHAQDEAERAAACVLQHLAAGRVPVALAATDRLLTRHVSGLLAARGVSLRDETGWKLSTTRAAAQVMAALKACAWDAPSDAVLDWLKQCSAFASPAVQALEARLRSSGISQWHALPGAWVALPDPHATLALVATVNTLRSTLQSPRNLGVWLVALRELLQASGQWEPLLADAAGERVLTHLCLHEGARLVLAQLPQATPRLPLATFNGWASEVLEAATFQPDSAPQSHLRAQVVVLPLSQLLGRPFAALVLPACDEIHLPASPEPPGRWSAAQRTALGLPLRIDLQAQARAAFAHALQVSVVDLLWRQGDEGGQTVLPSPLVQALRLQHRQLTLSPDPREPRRLLAAPTAHPQPQAAVLLQAAGPQRLSASAYEDLRRCPYRFFALRQLGLREDDEIDTELTKRDFGSWLHAVLSVFHQALPEDRGSRLDLINQCAQQTQRSMAFSHAEFLPFATAWPQLRDGYLAWLAAHEAQGHVFAQAESPHEVNLRQITLVGRIDRIDQSRARFQPVAQPRAETTAFLLDYKTESLQASTQRVRQPTEDTQLLFYAALLPDDDLRAAYVNVGERETKTVEQRNVVPARDLLVQGILHDMQAIADGAALPALGEGSVCDFCAARGLCRKDFWGAA